MQRQARLPEFFDQTGKNTLFWDLVQNTPPHPPVMKSWPDIGTLSFDYYRTPPPPPPFKFRHILALYVLTTTEHPHHPPPPHHSNLGRSWHFEF